MAEGVAALGRPHIRSDRIRYGGQISLFRLCSMCRTEKLISEFAPRKSRPDGLEYRCKTCNNQATIRNRRMRSYGLTRGQYDAMVMEQCGTCAICGQPETARNRQLSVDHDHSTGAIRGLLCSRCNTALGLLQDDVRVISRAASYLGQVT